MHITLLGIVLWFCATTVWHYLLGEDEVENF